MSQSHSTAAITPTALNDTASFSGTPVLIGAAQRRASLAVPIVWADKRVVIGGDAPVVVQSMTNTDTADAIATAMQIKALYLAGSELVRITVNTAEAAREVPAIREQLDRMGIPVPLIGDFHFNGHKLLADYPDCAKALSKFRINPGNVGKGSRRDEHFAQFIELACRHERPVRIGVNWGSLDPATLQRHMDQNALRNRPWSARQVMVHALVDSALESAAQARDVGLPSEKIVLSCKVSAVQDLIAAYQLLAQCSNHALHIGLTEAGMGLQGTVSSSAALAVLLQSGIGDTIRVSLTPAPGEARTQEVEVAQRILQSLGLRAFTPQVIACPGCGRTTSTVFQTLAQRIEQYLQSQMKVWRLQHPGVESMQVAVMGCVVNGPGESKHANIGISLPGTGESPVAPVYIDGEKTVTLKGDRIAEEFQVILENYVARRYPAATNTPVNT